jgi:hypothetical protein
LTANEYKRIILENIVAKILPLVRKNVLLEEGKVQKLMRQLKAKDESEAIRAAIEDRLFADEVMKHVQQLRRRGTVRDAYKRAVGK